MTSKNIGCKFLSVVEMDKERFYRPPFLKWHVSKIAASTEDLSTKKNSK